MSKLSYRVSYYVLYVIFAAIVIVLGLFYLGGNETTSVVMDMSTPAYTDALLYLMYGLVALTVVVTIIAFIAQFAASFKDNPVAALKSLAGIVLLVVVLIAAWSMGSDQKLEITGYEGTDNVPFWLKLTDMFLYTLYFLLGAAILAMLGSSIKKMLS